ncbi:MAG: hypothetical protein ACLT98_17970 [Eggerthellaceae bacterium]
MDSRPHLHEGLLLSPAASISRPWKQVRASAGRARQELHGRLAEGKPTHRNVREISFHPETVMGENLMSIKVVGNAFLHSMVRTIVGTLVMVGKGQRDADWVGEVLEACDRRVAGENAPAQGLVFWRVIY